MIADNTFAAACYNDNTVAELIAILDGQADVADMKEWDLTAGEWRHEMEIALSVMLSADTDEIKIIASGNGFSIGYLDGVPMQTEHTGTMPGHHTWEPATEETPFTSSDGQEYRCRNETWIRTDDCGNELYTGRTP